VQQADTNLELVWTPHVNTATSVKMIIAMSKFVYTPLKIPVVDLDELVRIAQPTQPLSILQFIEEDKTCCVLILVSGA
jgi:hypothetical protein